MKTEEKKTRYVIVSAADGIYLGNAMGLGFWSKLDPVGQDAAVTFPTAESAREHTESWKTVGTGVIGLSFVPVQVSGRVGLYASIEECVAAGLDAWDPNMKPAEPPEPFCRACGDTGVARVSALMADGYAACANERCEPGRRLHAFFKAVAAGQPIYATPPGVPGREYDQRILSTGPLPPGWTTVAGEPVPAPQVTPADAARAQVLSGKAP